MSNNLQARRELISQFATLGSKYDPEDQLVSLTAALVTAIVIQSNTKAETLELLEAVHQRMLLMAETFAPIILGALDELDREGAEHG